MTSQRHHFIPEFILRNFTNDTGSFFIYHPKKDSFKANGKLFYPKQQFYEYDANRATKGKYDSVFIEEMYAHFDSRVGSLIHSYKTDNHFKPSIDEWMLLQHFVDSMYWRNPATINRLKNKVKIATSLEELGFGSFHDSKMKMRLEHVTADDGIYKFVKLLMPMTREIASKKELSVFMMNYSLHLNGIPLPSLIGDNPTVYRNENPDAPEQDEFIFPFAPNLILIRTKVERLAIWKHLKILLDILQLEQATEYVAVTDLRYPKALREYFSKTFHSTAELRQTIFKLIFEYQEIMGSDDILHI